MLRFDYVPYPLWRRRWPGPLKKVAPALLRPLLAGAADENPPATARQLVRFMARWRLLNGIVESEARRLISDRPAQVELTYPDRPVISAPDGPVRLPAQWEPMETILMTWPVLYPPLWKHYAEMVKAIVPVAGVTINIPRPTWADGIQLFLTQSGLNDLRRVRFLHLPTDDIWVRDYGPFVGLDAQGQQVAVHAIYDPLETYPQQRDNDMVRRWAAHSEIPLRELDLHTEGGNYWSDGMGTFIMSDETLMRHNHLGRAEVERRLHSAFHFEKLIVTPHLLQEETGHVDLLVKLADARTVLMTEARPSLSAENLRKTSEMFRRETNARGERYTIAELPALPRYRNWGVFSIWRSYTNSLTVNGRVLVPIYGEANDEVALRIYEQAMPKHEIIPIDCKIGANGGGAVHCMTKEVPAAAPTSGKERLP